ncbi:multicopper oxidase domain-containing protein [Methyloprofundus sedimenti]|nr:multicopper oxidase domain-containing protein [Methyloprofundus sedimenti]
MHVNPFWLSRVDVPIADGTLVHILTEPRWPDVTWLPRGRAIFRSRFPDYVGEYVNHCHILLHQDNGMMQLVEVVASAGGSNDVARFKVSQSSMSAEQVTAIYPRVSLSEAFVQSGSFVDANSGIGQIFPGFDIQYQDEEK